MRRIATLLLASLWISALAVGPAAAATMATPQRTTHVAADPPATGPRVSTLNTTGAETSRVAVIGVPGLQWSDLSATATPTLWKLVAEGASGALSTRAVPPPDRGVTCPVQGWLTVSAGQRAGAPDLTCASPPAPQGATVPGWRKLADHQSTTGYDARLGTLGQRVRDAGGKVLAIGPGAALGAADSTGSLDSYADSTAAAGDLTPYRLIVMEAGDVSTAWFAQPRTDRDFPDGMPEEARTAAVTAADRRIGELLTRLPQGTTVLVAGISDTGVNAHLHVAIAHGGPYRHSYLTATSTKQNGLVTITDLTATALRLLNLNPPNEVVGRAWENGRQAPDAAQTVSELADQDLASQVLREVRGPFFTVLVTVQLLFYALAAIAFRRSGASSPASSRVLAAVQVFAVISGAIAVATFLAQLVPWWSLPVPMLGVIATILGFAGLVTLIAFAGPWRGAVLGPLTVVSAITSLTLLIDVMTGSALQVNAVTGYEPVTGGRFYGYGNIAFAVFATGTILALTGISHWLLGKGVPRLVVLLLAGAYGALAVFADGWPGWGADFGGVPAYVVGLAVLLIPLSGRKVTVLNLSLVALAGAVLIGGISYLDWLRPVSERTHLGAFVQEIIDGGAFTIIGRKFSAMVGVTVGNWSLTLLSLVALAFLFLVLNRPSRWGVSALGQAYAAAPLLRAGLSGTLAAALIGFLMNDSGIAIPAMAFTVAVPLALAASVRALQLASPTMPTPPSTAADSTAPPAA